MQENKKDPNPPILPTVLPAGSGKNRPRRPPVMGIIEGIQDAERRRKERFAKIQAVDLAAVRNPLYLNDPEVNTLLRSELIGSFPESLPGVAVGAVSKERDKDDRASEDACAISQDRTRFAISDGVSNSWIPRPWAAMLVQKWVENPLFSLENNKWQEWLKNPKAAWRIWVADRFEVGKSLLDKSDQDRVDYSLRETLFSGASATFLGAQIDPQQQQVRALAVGDSCMFLIHPGNLSFESFPLKDPSEFTNRPDQIGSLEEWPVKGCQDISVPYFSGDILVLATDAISKWLMKSFAGDFKTSLDILRGLSKQKFSEFIQQGWDNRSIETDDATLMVISLDSYNPGRRSIPNLPTVLPAGAFPK